MSFKINFEVYFCNEKLVYTLFDNETIEEITEQVKGISSIPDHLFNVRKISILKNFILKLFSSNNITSIDEKLLTGQKFKTGELVWIRKDFYFKEVGVAKQKLKKGNLVSYANFYTKIKLNKEFFIKGSFNVEHLHTSSAVSMLKGHTNKFIFAYIHEIKDCEIFLRPIIIGELIDNTIRDFNFHYSALIHPTDIDSFSLMNNVDIKKVKLEQLKNIPEAKIKGFIAEILYEQNIPKDWGGENSDLFTANLNYKGQKKYAAFAFKGPSKFHPMKYSDLGKNGDQIVRLFHEPADIFFLVHCHYIGMPIIHTVEAFAISRNKYACIIDGYQLLCILKAYGKIR